MSESPKVGGLSESFSVLQFSSCLFALFVRAKNVGAGECGSVVLS